MALFFCVLAADLVSKEPNLYYSPLEKTNLAISASMSLIYSHHGVLAGQPSVEE